MPALKSSGFGLRKPQSFFFWSIFYVNVWCPKPYRIKWAAIITINAWQLGGWSVQGKTILIYTWHRFEALCRISLNTSMNFSSFVVISSKKHRSNHPSHLARFIQPKSDAIFFFSNRHSNMALAALETAEKMSHQHFAWNGTLVKIESCSSPVPSL